MNLKEYQCVIFLVVSRDPHTREPTYMRVATREDVISGMYPEVSFVKTFVDPAVFEETIKQQGNK